jgi:two-component system OmpR family sensor kinase
MSRLHSLRWRLAAMYATIAAVMLIAILTVVASSVETALIESTAERLTIEAGLVAAESGPGRSRARATDLAAGDLATVLGGYGTAVVILGPDGDTLAAEGNGAPAGVLDTRLDRVDYLTVVTQQTPIDAVRPRAGGGRVLVVAAPVQLRTTGPGNSNGRGIGKGNGNGRGLGNQGDGVAEQADGPANAVAQLAISLDGIDGTLADLRLRLTVVGIGVLAFVVVVAWFLTRLGLRALERVTSAADRFAAGNIEARARLPDGVDEVGRLGRAFDGMAERVDATLTAQRQFAADASHELRTPLTVLGGYVDVLSTADVDPATHARTLVAMRREIDRLSRLSADLLLLTQLEAGGGRLIPREVDLGDLVEDIGAAARIIGPDRRVEVVRDGQLPVIADPDRLTQALMNLVDNAVRHAGSGGTVTLTASRSNGLAVAEVSNTGQQIPAADLARVFDRFYRGSRGTAAGTDGHAGLGLAIVQAIAEASGGSVTATSDAERTSFAIRLPAAR